MEEQFKKRKLFLNGGLIVTWEFHQYDVHVVVGFVYAIKHSLRAETNSLVSRHFVYVTFLWRPCQDQWFSFLGNNPDLWLICFTYLSWNLYFKRETDVCKKSDFFCGVAGLSPRVRTRCLTSTVRYVQCSRRIRTAATGVNFTQAPVVWYGMVWYRREICG